MGHREPGYATLFARGMIHSLCRTVSHHSGQIRPPFVHAKHQPGSFDVSDINVCVCVYACKRKGEIVDFVLE